GYDLESGAPHPWISKEGKFTDTLEGDLTEGDLCALYAYLRHLRYNLNRVKKFYTELVTGLDPEYANVQSLLQDWHKKMEAYAEQRHFNLESGSVPPVDIHFDAPFSYLFNFKDVLYGKDGILTTHADGDAISFDPKKALLPKESEIARVILDPIYDQNPARLSELPVYVLKAPIKDDPGHYAFFALPLSALGLNVFGRNVSALAGVAAPGNSLTSTLTAIYDEGAPENNLEVTLSLVTTDGKTRIFKEAYTVRNDKSIFNRDIILWPNFISRQWNRYFLYSEMPHDAKSVDYPYRAMPFVADEKSAYTRILVDRDSEPVYLASNGEVKTHYDKD
ncbi:MAG: hypothetical protein K2K93_10425, partial [Muribaculaceae bacterium]|nr:hypothetical protein [Muribaculaceae bacterium]